MDGGDDNKRTVPNESLPTYLNTKLGKLARVLVGFDGRACCGESHSGRFIIL